MQGITFPCFLIAMLVGNTLGLTPKLIVFDLDDTLWPDLALFSPPFTKDSNGSVYDYNDRLVQYFPDVPCILNTLHKEGYLLGIASRTNIPEEVIIIMSFFRWQNYFEYKELYTGSKITHFTRIRDKSGIAFHDMMLFDDYMENIEDVSALGVSCVLVKDELTIKLIKNELEKYNQNLKFNC